MANDPHVKKYSHMHNFLKPTARYRSQNLTIMALLRHGKTEWNEESRIQGRLNSPLSQSGRKQVHAWGLFLQKHTIHQIIASDLGRVKETVRILRTYCNHTPVIWNPSLREQSWGKWEGKTFHELKSKHLEEFTKQIRAGWDFRPPYGESRKEVLQRSLPVIHKILLDFAGKHILIVSHEGIVNSLIYHLAGRAFLPEEPKLLENRQIHLLIGKDETLTLGPVNIFSTSK